MTVSRRVRGNQSSRCSDSALRNSGTAHTSFLPSVKNRTVWFSCIPRDFRNSNSRRLDLLSYVCT